MEKLCLLAEFLHENPNTDLSSPNTLRSMYGQRPATKGRRSVRTRRKKFILTTYVHATHAPTPSVLSIEDNGNSNMNKGKRHLEEVLVDIPCEEAKKPKLCIEEKGKEKVNEADKDLVNTQVLHSEEKGKDEADKGKDLGNVQVKKRKMRKDLANTQVKKSKLEKGKDQADKGKDLAKVKSPKLCIEEKGKDEEGKDLVKVKNHIEEKGKDEADKGKDLVLYIEERGKDEADKGKDLVLYIEERGKDEADKGKDLVLCIEERGKDEADKGKDLVCIEEKGKDEADKGKDLVNIEEKGKDEGDKGKDLVKLDTENPKWQHIFDKPLSDTDRKGTNVKLPKMYLTKLPSDQKVLPMVDEDGTVWEFGSLYERGKFVGLKSQWKAYVKAKGLQYGDEVMFYVNKELNMYGITHRKM